MRRPGRRSRRRRMLVVAAVIEVVVMLALVVAVRGPAAERPAAPGTGAAATARARFAQPEDLVGVARDPDYPSIPAPGMPGPGLPSWSEPLGTMPAEPPAEIAAARALGEGAR